MCINVRISIRREVNTKTLNIISDKKESNDLKGVMDLFVTFRKPKPKPKRRSSNAMDLPMLERFHLLVSGSVRFLRGTLTLHCNLHVGHLFPNPPKTAIWNIAY